MTSEICDLLQDLIIYGLGIREIHTALEILALFGLHIHIYQHIREIFPICRHPKGCEAAIRVARRRDNHLIAVENNESIACATCDWLRLRLLKYFDYNLIPLDFAIFVVVSTLDLFEKIVHTVYGVFSEREGCANTALGL
jgi:hypothetical protein